MPADGTALPKKHISGRSGRQSTTGLPADHPLRVGDLSLADLRRPPPPLTRRREHRRAPDALSPNDRIGGHGGTRHWGRALSSCGCAAKHWSRQPAVRAAAAGAGSRTALARCLFGSWLPRSVRALCAVEALEFSQGKRPWEGFDVLAAGAGLVRLELAGPEQDLDALGT
jgi:hypothetical protein